jgi:HAD superfamily hydrolase (TIGR01509 family)
VVAVTGGGLAAVLFDLDGTLINSEPLWEVALRELARRYGGELSSAARQRMVGTSTDDSMAILHADLNQPWRDVAESGAWLDARVERMFAAGVPWRAGARELLAEVRAAGVPTALVTATKRSLVEALFDSLGRPEFDAVVCGDDIALTKPDPLPYLTAAAALGVDPRRCVAIEDSPTGAASAAAAGCVVVAVPAEALFSTVDGYHVVKSLVGTDLALLRSLSAGQL